MIIDAHSHLRVPLPSWGEEDAVNIYGVRNSGVEDYLRDALGPEKLLFGSDGGIGHPAVTAAYLRRIERLRAPPAHIAMILGDNARRFMAGA